MSANVLLISKFLCFISVKLNPVSLPDLVLSQLSPFSCPTAYIVLLEIFYLQKKIRNHVMYFILFMTSSFQNISYLTHRLILRDVNENLSGSFKELQDSF